MAVRNCGSRAEGAQPKELRKQQDCYSKACSHPNCEAPPIVKRPQFANFNQFYHLDKFAGSVSHIIGFTYE